MISRLRQLFSPPVFEDEEQTRVVRLLNTVLIAFMAAILATIPLMVATSGWPLAPEALFTIISACLIVVVAGWLLLVARRGRARFAGLVLLGLCFGIMSFWVLRVSGLNRDTSPLMFPLIIVLAGLILGGRAALGFTWATGLVLLAAFFLEKLGYLRVTHEPPAPLDLLFAFVPLFLMGLLLRYAIRTLTDALDRARRNEHAQIEANRELQGIRASLEERVSERTRELERRSVQLQAAVQVSQAATSILDMNQLMWQAVELLQQRFDLYHVGLFQLDATRRWAEYKAGAGAAGRELADEGFRLEVGGASVIGWCVARGEARIVPDVRLHSLRVDHTLVPATQSEAALPLIARGQVIGALSVQSARLAAFDDETLAALRTIADQVAIALDNARLFAESQESLAAMRRAYGELGGLAWTELLRTRGDWGYSYARRAVEPLPGDWSPELIAAVQTGQTLKTAGPTNGGGREPGVAVPIKVRERVIGVLGFYKEAPATGWTDDEVDLLEELAGQLGLALESARLYQDTQRRAARERLTSEMTGRVRETLDIDNVLQTAIREIGNALGLAEVEVRLLSGAQTLHGRGVEVLS